MELFTFGVAQFGKSVLASVLMQFQENYLTVSSQLIFWGSHWVFGENRLKGCSHLEVPESEGLLIGARPPLRDPALRFQNHPGRSFTALFCCSRRTTSCWRCRTMTGKGWARAAGAATPCTAGRRCLLGWGWLGPAGVEFC